MPIQNAWAKSRGVIHSPRAFSASSGTMDVHIPKQSAFVSATLRSYAAGPPAAPPADSDSYHSQSQNSVATCGIISFTADGERNDVGSENPWGSEAFIGSKAVESITFSWVLDSAGHAEADFAFQVLGWGE